MMRRHLEDTGFGPPIGYRLRGPDFGKLLHEAGDAIARRLGRDIEFGGADAAKQVEASL